MTFRRATTGLGLLALLAFCGWLLVTVPPTVVSQFQEIESASDTVRLVYLVSVGTGGTLLALSVCGCIWFVWSRTRRKRRRQKQSQTTPGNLSPQQRQEEIDQNLAQVQDLRGDPSVSGPVQRELDSLIHELEAKQESQELQIAAFGTVSSGKSSVLNALAGREVFATDARGGTTIHRNQIPWPGTDRLTLVDTPGIDEIDGAAHVHIATTAAQDADLVLLVVDGALRSSEFELLQRLGEMEKKVLVCLNKEDWFTEDDRNSLLDQIGQQLSPQVSRRDIVTVQAKTAQRARTRITSSGQEVEEFVELPVDISDLADRMMELVEHDGRDLLLANLLLQSRGMVDQAQDRIRHALETRARSTVDGAMWAAGGAAALSPLPLVDLAAGSAISVKMVIDLSRIFRQEIDVQTALKLLGELGKNLIAILGVSAATPAAASAVATILKTVPGAGTLAGGMLQGAVQALVTRWIGMVFIKYFQNEMHQPAPDLASLARREWQRLTTINELRKVLQAARTKMHTDDSPD